MSTFERYAADRARLLGRCNELKEINRLLVAGETELEAYGGGKADGSIADDVIGDIRARLSSATIEVGVFGEVKRGKSTLMNALVGEVVSSMRVTPETAVPVWVEDGDYFSAVVYEDGGIEEFDDPAKARERGSQRFRNSSKRAVARVVQRLPVDWLPRGLRIVDTPGLDDPSLFEEYEALTLSELDRMSAAVFVLVSPPGPGGDEVRLLKSLGEHGVDKVFLVCNFYPDNWANPDDRNDVLEYVRKLVVQDATSGEDGVKVYAVSAKQGLEAVLKGDDEKYRDSGVEQLRHDLEQYLSTGVLQTLTAVSEQRLRVAGRLLSDQIHQRRALLQNPSAVESRRSELQQQIKSSETVVASLLKKLEDTASELSVEVAEIMVHPFKDSKPKVDQATRGRELSDLERRLNLRLEDAASRASVHFDSRTSAVSADVQRRLYETFGVTDRVLSKATSIGTHVNARDVSTGVRGRTNWGAVGATSGLGMVGGSLIGGSLAGGVGIALIALGPVGWLIGAGIGTLIGAGVGTAAGSFFARDLLSDQDRLEVRNALDKKAESTRQLVSTKCAEWAALASESLLSSQSRFYEGQRKELSNVDRLLGDSAAKARALRELDEVEHRLMAAVPQLDGELSF